MKRLQWEYLVINKNLGKLPLCLSTEKLENISFVITLASISESRPIKKDNIYETLNSIIFLGLTYLVIE